MGKRHHLCCTKIRHDEVIKWKHFPRYWPFVRGIHRSPVNSPHKGQWRGALMFTFICARINSWVNNHEAGDLRRHRAHYDIITMKSRAEPHLSFSRARRSFWITSSGQKRIIKEMANYRRNLGEGTLNLILSTIYAKHRYMLEHLRAKWWLNPRSRISYGPTHEWLTFSSTRRSICCVQYLQMHLAFELKNWQSGRFGETVPSNYLNQWWTSLLTLICLFRLRCVINIILSRMYQSTQSVPIPPLEQS